MKNVFWQKLKRLVGGFQILQILHKSKLSLIFINFCKITFFIVGAPPSAPIVDLKKEIEIISLTEFKDVLFFFFFFFFEWLKCLNFRLTPAYDNAMWLKNELKKSIS